MNTQTWLGALLVAQVLLALGLYASGRGDQGGNLAEQLLDFPVAQIDRIEINDNINATTLKRHDEQWRLAAPADLPASQTRVSTLLDTLAGLQTGWPVVSTAAGRERFEVTQDTYQRKLSLYAGDDLQGEYYFGTSPGFRQTHGRRADDDEVYALAFNNFDLPGDPNDWLDKTLLASTEPTLIRGPDFALSKSGEQWQLDASPEPDNSGTLDQDQAGQLVRAFSNLRVLRVEDALPEGERVVYEVSNGAGSWKYQFVNANDRYYVHRDDRQQAFTISQADYERIVNLRRDSLIMQESTVAEDTPADGNA